MNKVIAALILYFFYSCGLLSESLKVIVYESSNFENLKTSQKPDYNNLATVPPDQRRGHQSTQV